MTVDIRPSDDNRSFWDISRWKRAIESVSELKVVASSLASSSSHRRLVVSMILRVKSPVAATSRMTPVMAASGWVTVRATAKLNSVPSRTATTAVISSSVCNAWTKRICSVRERRISAAGPLPSPAASKGGARGWRRATNSCCSMVTLRGRPFCRSSSATAPRWARGSVLARTWPSIPKAISLPVASFNCPANASSSRNPTLSVPRISGRARPMEIGTVTSCRIPADCGMRLKPSFPCSALRTVG